MVRRLSRQKRSEALQAYAFLAPALIIFMMLVLLPVFFSIFLSFTNWKFTSGLNGIEWVGMKNFAKLLRDKSFIFALKNTFVYTLTCVPISILVSVILAYELNGRVYIQKGLRTFIFIPYISNMVALALLFRCLFRSNGIVNSVLIDLFSMDKGLGWLSDNSLNKIPVILLSSWSSIGYSMIIYIAAMQGVPQSVYEAANIDGASDRQCFWRITVPLISQTTFFLMIIRMIAVFKIFTSVNVLTGENVARGNISLVVKIYQDAFGSYNFGYASAEALVLFVIILLFTLLQFWGKEKWTYAQV